MMGVSSGQLADPLPWGHFRHTLSASGWQGRVSVALRAVAGRHLFLEAAGERGREGGRVRTPQGYSIVDISSEDQLKYGCNVLNLGDSRIISVHPGTARQIVRHPDFKGVVQVRGYAAAV